MRLVKNLMQTVVAGAVLLGASVPAMAATAPLFTIDPAVVAGMGPVPGISQAPFVANQISGNSSELLHTVPIGPAGGHVADGWLQMQGFALNSSPVSVLVSGYGVYYNLYATFHLEDVYRVGTGTGINTVNSINDLTVLDVKFWADPLVDTAFTPAGIPGQEATRDANFGDDILLAVGNLVSGRAGFNPDGPGFGAFLNATLNFAVCNGAGTASFGGANATGALGALATACATDHGDRFFMAPEPFYDMAFASFNNTSQGVVIDPLTGDVAINQAVGNVDFNNRIPEPASVLLLAGGLLGLCASMRRRKA